MTNIEEKLKESEVMYRHLFNNTPYAIWLVNLKGVIVDCNDNMNKFMSIFKKEDLIGKNFRDVIRLFLSKGDLRFENLEKVFKERFKRLLKQGYLEPIEFEISRGDGEAFWITLETSFIKMSKESLIQLFIKDITKRKEAELSIKELNKELEQRIEERTKELKESEKEFRTAYKQANFYKNLFAHDISNILTAIMGSVDLYSLYEDDLTKLQERNSLISIIKDQVAKGALLVSNVRKLSELEEKKEVYLKKTEIGKTLDNAMKFVHESFQQREINFQVDYLIKNPIVLANDLLSDVFGNILNNAVKYNDNPVVKIQIKISREKKGKESNIKLEFIDNGIGVSDDNKKIIFKKGFKQKKGSKGMGFGLTLVKSLIKSYNGQIWVEDKIKGDYTKGSNFIILIPENIK